MDEINSPEYSPIKESNEDEYWSDEKIKEKIETENAKDLFSKDELTQIMKKINAETGAGVKSETRLQLKN